MPDLFDIDSGPLGIEALLTWNGSLVLNDRTDDAHFHISRLTGLHSAPDHEDPRAGKFGRPGENVYPTSPLGKTVVAEGQFRATTLPGLRSFGRTMRAAFADLRTDGFMDIEPHADLGGPAARFYARPMELAIDDVQSSSRWTRGAVLGLRMSDPRFYFPSLAVDVTNATSAAVTNDGSAPADPVLTLAGASGDVEVTDGTRVLTFQNVPAGTMIINFAARTAKVADENCELVVFASDWWDSFVDGIAPGASVSIAQTGATSIQVEFTPAAW